MKYVIAGSRDLHISMDDLKALLKILNVEINPDQDIIISGGCPTGPDATAKTYANKYDINYVEYPALWDKHGRAAGPIRNAEMAKEADYLILIWNGESRGSKNMRSCMEYEGKPVYEAIIRSYQYEKKE